MLRPIGMSICALFLTHLYTESEKVQEKVHVITLRVPVTAKSFKFFDLSPFPGGKYILRNYDLRIGIRLAQFKIAVDASHSGYTRAFHSLYIRTRGWLHLYTIYSLDTTNMLELAPLIGDFNMHVI